MDNQIKTSEAITIRYITENVPRTGFASSGLTYYWGGDIKIGVNCAVA